MIDPLVQLKGNHHRPEFSLTSQSNQKEKTPTA